MGFEGGGGGPGGGGRGDRLMEAQPPSLLFSVGVSYLVHILLQFSWQARLIMAVR